MFLNTLVRIARNIRTTNVCEHIAKRTMGSHPTAGIIVEQGLRIFPHCEQRNKVVKVIGDEILKGQTADTNSHFLCRRLFSLGVKVRRISVVGDDVDSIAKEIAKFSHRYTHVITTGGIGPTHDDCTFEALAQAFNENTAPHPELVTLCSRIFGTDDLSSPKLKLAIVPESAQLHYGTNPKTGEKTKFPVISVKNVFVFPGIPNLTEYAFTLLEGLFRNDSVQFHIKEIYVNKDEFSIADSLTEIDMKYRKQIMLGSYPDMLNSYYRVKITMESEHLEFLNEAYDSLISLLPPGCVIAFEKDPIGQAVQHIYDIVNSDSKDQFTQRVRCAVRILEEAVQKYSLSEISVGFNGGKDCTVLLHLFHAVVRKHYPEHTDNLCAMYIRSKLPFPEVETFIQESRDRYKLTLVRLEGQIKECLMDLQTSNPEIKVILMGTRATDPYSAHLNSFAMTDPDWPQYMRVNPLLGWTYEDVWMFLRSLYLPYCSLYDRGFTSLGSMNNTHPNPALQYFTDKGIVCYKPAYQLSTHDTERDGRN